MAPVGIHVDVGIVRNPAPMAGLHAGATPIPATFGRLRRTAQSRNISRAKRESSR